MAICASGQAIIRLTRICWVYGLMLRTLMPNRLIVDDRTNDLPINVSFTALRDLATLGGCWEILTS